MLMIPGIFPWKFPHSANERMSAGSVKFIITKINNIRFVKTLFIEWKIIS